MRKIAIFAVVVAAMVAASLVCAGCQKHTSKVPSATPSKAQQTILINKTEVGGIEIAVVGHFRPSDITITRGLKGKVENVAKTLSPDESVVQVEVPQASKGMYYLQLRGKAGTAYEVGVLKYDTNSKLIGKEQIEKGRLSRQIGGKHHAV